MYRERNRRPVHLIVLVLLLSVLAHPVYSQTRGRDRLWDLKVYSRSVAGSLAGAAAVLVSAMLLDVLSGTPPKWAAFGMFGRVYQASLAGSPVGSALMQFDRPNPTIHSFQQFSALFLIAGMEVTIYHLAYGSRAEHPLRGLLLLEATVVPLTQLWYLRFTASDDPGGGSSVLPPYDPGPGALIQWSAAGVRVGAPAWVVELQPEKNAYIISRSTTYLLTLVSLSF